MIWFTGDTHFGHANIIKYCKRPFKHVDEMDEKIITNWNSVVQAGDEVYHLGDFAFHHPQKAAYYASRLKGKKYLIRGNHDHNRICRELVNYFEWIKDVHLLKIDQSLIWLSHYAHLIWPQKHYGVWHLFGHSHGMLNKDQKEVNSYDVGVDCHYFQPVSYDWLRKTCNNGF